VAVLETEIAMAENDGASASRSAEEAVKLAPQSAAAHYVLGATRMRSGDATGAGTEWQAALDQDSSFVPARLALASDRIAAGDGFGAENYIITVVRDEPANIEALSLFARALELRKHYREAEQIARRAVAVDPKSAAPHLLLGDVAVKEENAATALKEYERALMLEPHSQAALNALINLYRHAEVTRPMLRRLEAVAQQEPASPTLLEIAGRLYAEHHWYDDASRCLRRALEMDPRRSTAATALAQIQASTGQISAAMVSAMRTNDAAAAMLAAGQAQDRNDFGSATRQYEEAVRRGDRTGIAANNLAWLYASQGKELDRALELAQSAHGLSPHNPAILDTLGYVYLKRREYSQAVEQLELAAHLASGDQESSRDTKLLEQIREHLSEAYRRAGQPQAAQLQLVRMKTGS
jgi:tetratricopeptide (TPR) repeat protein